VFEIEFFFPDEESFDSNWSESSEFGSFENFFGFFDNFNFGFIGSTLNEVLSDPESDFFDDFVDDGFSSVFVDEIFDSFGDGIEIIPGEASDRFDVVLDCSFGVGFGEFELNWEFVLKLVLRDVRSDKDREFMRGMFLDGMEFVQINVGKNLKFILLKSYTFEFDFGCEAVGRLGHLAEKWIWDL
jgi:hypothetical protein